MFTIKNRLYSNLTIVGFFTFILKLYVCIIWKLDNEYDFKYPYSSIVINKLKLSKTSKEVTYPFYPASNYFLT